MNICYWVMYVWHKEQSCLINIDIYFDHNRMKLVMPPFDKYILFDVCLANVTQTFLQTTWSGIVSTWLDETETKTIANKLISPKT